MRKYANKSLNFNITLDKKGYYEDLTGNIIKLNDKMFIVTDNYREDICITFKTELEALRYINRLVKARSNQEYLFIKTSTRAGVKENSIVKFQNGKMGIILDSSYFDPCMKYKTIKKNGDIGVQVKKFYKHMDYIVCNY